jgi:hypothetical protein
MMSTAEPRKGERDEEVIFESRFKFLLKVFLRKTELLPKVPGVSEVSVDVRE